MQTKSDMLMVYRRHVSPPRVHVHVRDCVNAARPAARTYIVASRLEAYGSGYMKHSILGACHDREGQHAAIDPQSVVVLSPNCRKPQWLFG